MDSALTQNTHYTYYKLVSIVWCGLDCRTATAWEHLSILSSPWHLPLDYKKTCQIPQYIHDTVNNQNNLLHHSNIWQLFVKMQNLKSLMNEGSSGKHALFLWLPVSNHVDLLCFSISNVPLLWLWRWNPSLHIGTLGLCRRLQRRRRISMREKMTCITKTRTASKIK